MTTTLVLSVLAIFTAMALVVVRSLREILPGWVERQAGLDTLESQAYTLHADAEEAAERLLEKRETRERLARESIRLESDIRKIEKAVDELDQRPPLFVHEIGDPRATLVRYVIDLRHSAASSSRKRDGSAGRLPSPTWSYPNAAEVWAQSQDEAIQLVDARFPTKLGFVKSLVTAPSSTDRLVEQALKLERAAS